MGKTYKDRKRRYDKNLIEFNSGVKKQFKRRSNKKMRHTPITREIVAYDHIEQEIVVKIPRNIIKGGIPTLKEIKINITIMIPYLEEVEITPKRLDIWEIE